VTSFFIIQAFHSSPANARASAFSQNAICALAIPFAPNTVRRDSRIGASMPSSTSVGTSDIAPGLRFGALIASMRSCPATTGGVDPAADDTAA
jgi:hypothetical protein